MDAGPSELAQGHAEEEAVAERTPRRLSDTEIAAKDAEIARLRHDLARMHSSRTWRLGRIVQHLLAIGGMPHLLIGRPTKLRPMRDIEVTASGKAPAVWQFKGGDPQIELEWAHRWPLPRGHYEFTITVGEDTEWTREMHFYADTGRGYNEGERIPLYFVPNGKSKFTARLSLHHLTEQLRLDPAEQEGLMTMAATARLRMFTRAEYYGKAIVRVLHEQLSAGRSLSGLAAAGWRRFRTGGFRGMARALRGSSNDYSSGVDYATWVARHDTLTDDDFQNIREQLATLSAPPKISVLMPVYNTPEALLREAIESVREQLYENWELCIANDCSTAPHVARVLDKYAALDPRIRVVHRPANGHISRASNSALELVSGDWVALLDHDDLLRPHALAEVALELARQPEAELIYSDEDKLSPNGARYDPNFKPDFSRELFRSQNYLNHLTVHRTANIRAVGGWRTGFEGSQDYDLNLRICERIGFRNIRHIPKVLYHWRAVAGSTAMSGSEKNYAYDAGFRALEEHVKRLGLPATVEDVPGTPFYRMHFAVPTPEPLVSLIIPTRDHVDVLRRAIASILDKTTYRNFEILVVDNGSTDPETISYLADLEARGVARVLPYDKPFNYSAINNFAAAQAKGEILGLINNDVEVISPDWLGEMVSWAIQPDVGCVGAKLYYPNDTIQHAGVVLGVGGVANHAFLGLDRVSLGPFGRAAVHNNWSAVTAACLVVRKALYDELGGLDAEHLAVAFNDIDFCLRVGERGLVNVWTPYAELYHHESVSRGEDTTPEKRERFVGEVTYMQKKWEQLLASDPYYSINYSKVMPAFRLSVQKEALR